MRVFHAKREVSPILTMRAWSCLREAEDGGGEMGIGDGEEEEESAIVVAVVSSGCVCVVTLKICGYLDV